MKLFHLDNDINILIPNNWEVENSDGVTSLYNPEEGVGVLQFSFYMVKQHQIVNLVEELEEYLNDKYEDIDIELIADHAYYETVDEDKIYWRYWLLLKNNQIVFASYNCVEGEKEKEEYTVDEMLKSIK